MSRAFVKEDLDEPERSTRRRSPSGLPPGALNYMTEAGAIQLRQRLAELKNAPGSELEASHLESSLEAATIVTPPDQTKDVVFGTTVTLKTAAGDLKTYRIVGVDEVDLEPGNVSWVAPIGKALLGAKIGQRVVLGPEIRDRWTVEKIQ